MFIELLRRNFKVSYYSNKGECDFVVKKYNKIEDLIQVCYELTNNNKKREINHLLNAMNHFKLNNATLITLDYSKELEIKNKKIHIIPIIKYLLDNKI